MAVGDLHTIGDELGRYRGFQECLLDAVHWRDAGRVMDLDFAYIWDDSRDGEILEKPRRVRVRLTDAVFVAIESPLTPVMLEHQDRLDWGVMEIAELRLARESERRSRPEGFEDALQLVAVWEGRGRLDIFFSDLTIEDCGQS